MELTRKVTMSFNNGEYLFSLYVTPKNIKVTRPHNTKKYISIEGKELNLSAGEGLRRVTINTFLPKKDSWYISNAEFTEPDEIILVVDSMTGQDAVNVAKSFNDLLEIDSVLLTKLDGDTRGGAALSVKAVTGKPIKFAGTGEKLDDIEEFHPSRMASRILGMGDVLSLIERAEQQLDEREAEQMAKRLAENKFDLNDLLAQFQQIKKMGSLKSILSMMPGMERQIRDVDIDDRQMLRVEAIIKSMTKKERAKPDIINASRKRRIAAGSGVKVEDGKKVRVKFTVPVVFMVQGDSGASKDFASLYAAGMDYIANGDIAKLEKISRFEERYGLHFAEARISFPDYDDQEITAKVILDTLESESASLTYEQSNALYQGVNEDYAHLTTKKKRYEAVREDKYYNALQLKYANAITCHKSQGGQWRCVFIDNPIWQDEMTVDDLKWLYTAITRATEKVYLVNFKDELFAD